ncbi:hypothetical protein TM5383_03007 [Thalassovita mediterranea]|uniref:Uncharacterized protein n=1 Tax=Thalassovita mediterranea TaxID=340021 RepID=A0A0P1GSV8_9RHOB|nr:hypothetical protein TM5383_03007 [Thalassovita mediterranea]SIS29743.1 hypothetical protein SAMN05421685_10242 [Thalassovita mediterranea]
MHIAALPRRLGTIATVVLCGATLIGCGVTDIPDRASTAAHLAPYPALVPIEVALAGTQAPQLDADSDAALTARANRLRARANSLRAQNGG